MANNISHYNFLDFVLYHLNEDDIKCIKKMPRCNQKATIIVYNGGENVTLDENLKLFLTKILQAIKFDIEKDVVLIPVSKSNTIALNDLKESFEIKNVLSFGVPMSYLGIHIDSPKFYEPILLNEIKFVLADDLQKLSSNLNRKRLFWQCLQATFLK